MLEVILARAQVRVMSDKMMITKKKPLKELAKLIAPLFLILGIFAGIVYICITYPPYSNNVFMMTLGLWLAALDSDLSALYAAYLAKGDLRSSITELRRKAIRDVKLITIMAYIFTAIYIVIGGLVLVTYLIYLRAVASGLTKNPSSPYISTGDPDFAVTGHASHSNIRCKEGDQKGDSVGNGERYDRMMLS